MNVENNKILTRLASWLLWIKKYAFVWIFISIAIGLILEFGPAFLYENRAIDYITNKVIQLHPSIWRFAQATPFPYRNVAVSAMEWLCSLVYLILTFIFEWPGYKSIRTSIARNLSRTKSPFSRYHICFVLLLAPMILVYSINTNSLWLYGVSEYRNPIFIDHFIVNTRLGYFINSCAWFPIVTLYWFFVAILLNFRLFWNKPAANTQTKLESHAQPQRD